MRLDLRFAFAWSFLACAASVLLDIQPICTAAVEGDAPRATADDEEGTPAKEPTPLPADAPTKTEAPDPDADETNKPQSDKSEPEKVEADQTDSTETKPGEIKPAAADANNPPAVAEQPAVTGTTAPATGPIDGSKFGNVRPGSTTAEQLHAVCGSPQRIEKINGGVRETYLVKGAGQVRVTLVDDVVQAVATRLEQPAPLEEVAANLQIADLEPVEVTDEQGQVLGLAYPERGVLLGFFPKSDSPMVFQFVIEPIDAQVFLARAEKRLATRYADCLTDIKQALELAKDNGRAHWLHAELMLRAGALETALRSSQKSVELESKDPEFRLTLAKVLAETGDFPQALEQARGVIEWGKAPPIVTALAYQLCGDFVARAQEHDYQQATQQHMQAIKLAEPLVTDAKQSVRRAAKELLIDANLAVAHDIGWGRWQHKSKVVPKWIARATAFADDMLAREQGSLELSLRVHEQSLSALAGVAEPQDAQKSIDQATQLGKKVLEDAKDPAYKAHLAWQLGVALADAVEIEAALHHWDQALALGQTALGYFDEGAAAGKQLPAHDYLRGRLCYRLGAIHAVEKADHKQAATWFDQAVPLLESPVPAAVIDSGKQGEIFVSMAVSYWDLKKREEALRLTDQGVKLMEQAAEEGLLAKTALAIPYGNLASMYAQIGDAQSAKKFSELAARHEETKAK